MATRVFGIGHAEAGSRWRQWAHHVCRAGVQGKSAIREFLVDRCVSLKVAYDVIHADPTGVETCGVPTLVGPLDKGNGLAVVVLDPVKTAVNGAHRARVAGLDSARCSNKRVLVVYKREDRDELNRFRYARLTSALGDGK